METTQEGPGPDDWIPVMLGFARDRSADGWVFTRLSDVREALTERTLLATVSPEGPRATEDLILARVVVHPDGSVATLPDPAGPPVVGPRLEEVVSGLAHEMKTVILVDWELAIGTAGVPLEDLPPEVTHTTDDRRHVYAWPGVERHVAAAAVFGLKEDVTWHDAPGWTVLASVPAPRRVLTGTPVAASRFPFVTLTRTGPERRIEYVAGKGKEDLRLMAWWGPWLEPVVDPAGAHEETRGLLEAMAHPRFGDDEMAQHPGLTEEQRVAVGAAMADQDGSAFFGRVCAAFGVPEVAARLAEQPTDEPDPALAGETMRPESRAQLARTTYREVTAAAETDDSPPTRPWQTLSVTELVLGLVFLASVVWDFLPGPFWIWLVLGLLLTADGVNDVVIAPWRRRRRAATD